MIQRTREDSVGALSDLGANIQLSASRITLGGRQHKISSLQAAYGALSASSLYMVYAVLSGSDAALVISPNLNSVGPAGYTVWKLVGAFWTDGASSFDRMQNIEGAPATPVGDWESFIPTGTWTTNTTYSGRYRRVGDSMEIDAFVALSGAPNAVTFKMDIPNGLSIDTSKISSTVQYSKGFGSAHFRDSSSGTGLSTGGVRYSTPTDVFTTGVNTNLTNQAIPFTWASGDAMVLNFTIPIAEWSGQSFDSAVPLKDR